MKLYDVMYLVSHDELKKDDKMKPNSTQSSGEVHGSQVNNIKVSSGATLLINSDGEMSKESSPLSFDADGNPISSDSFDKRGRKKHDSIEAQMKEEEIKIDGKRKRNPGLSYTPAHENVPGVGERKGESFEPANDGTNPNGTNFRKRRHNDDPIREEKRLKAKRQFVVERLAALEGKKPPPAIFDDVEMKELLDDDNTIDERNEDVDMQDITEENNSKSKKEFRKRKNEKKSSIDVGKKNLKEEVMKEIGIVSSSNKIKEKTHKRKLNDDNVEERYQKKLSFEKSREKGEKNQKDEEEKDIFMDEEQQDIESFAQDTIPNIIKKNTAKVLTKLNKHERLQDKQRESFDIKRKQQRGVVQNALRPLFQADKRKDFLWEDLLAQEKEKRKAKNLPSISVISATSRKKRKNDTFLDPILSKDLKSFKGDKRKVSPLWEDLLPVHEQRKINHFAGKKRAAMTDRETIEEDEERTQIPYKSRLLTTKRNKRKMMNSRFAGKKRAAIISPETIEEDEERTQIPYKRRLLTAKRKKRKFFHINGDEEENTIPSKKIKYDDDV